MSISIENDPFLVIIRNDTKYVTVKEGSRVSFSNFEEIAHFMPHLKDYFQIERLENILKLKVSKDVFKFLEEYLSITQSSKLLEDKIDVITELYRCLRNSATNEDSQNYICFKTNILETTKAITSLIEKHNLCMKIILQFLINIITSNKNVSEKVYIQFINFLISIIREDIHIYECSALIYNISLFIPLKIEEVEVMFQLFNESNQNEFLLFFIQNQLNCNEFWHFYNNLKIPNKLIALETLGALQIQDKQYNIPNVGVTCLISSFLKSLHIFFEINNATSDEVREVSTLLEILSSLSSKDEYIDILQQNKDILVTGAALLINFHKLGKQANNLFTPVQKLSESGPEELNSPVMCLKADLIRLLGNMCWKNKQIQNLAREAEIIPVILDCCNIDLKNPFIIQWCILAIKNLCDNNIENQNVIAGLHQKGTVPSKVLDEFGIALNSDGENQLKIVPLESLK